MYVIVYRMYEFVVQSANGWGGACSVGGQLLIVAGAHMSELQGRVIFDDRCYVLVG